MEVLIDNSNYNGPICRLVPGDRQPFGRAIGGVGNLGDHPTISRQHGEIVVTESAFTVEATGTFSGVTVADVSTPSRLHIPRGVGPVEIPFRDSVITVETDDGPVILQLKVIGSPRADQWASQWGDDPSPEPPEELSARIMARGMSTRPGRLHEPGRFRRSNGVYYTWFKVLVALCEPTLDPSLNGVAPTNKELQTRTGYSKVIVERMLANIYEALDIDPLVLGRPREEAIEIAVRNGIVTNAHLEMLRPRGE